MRRVLQAILDSERSKKLWGKMKVVGKLAATLKQVNDDGLEKKRARIKGHWDLVGVFGLFPSSCILL